MREDLKRELNMTFSVGLGPTKVLAKLGSKHQKPDGFTIITRENAERFLAETPLRRVWGIGPATSLYLEKQGLSSALDFAHKPEYWVRENLAKPVVELWQELRGEAVLPLTCGPAEIPHSIQVTRTFVPTREEEYLRSQLSKNVERACGKARRKALSVGEISFFLKTQSFEYVEKRLKLSRPTNAPQEIIAAVLSAFPQVFKKGRLYRASGITLSDLQDTSEIQLDLFAPTGEPDRLTELYKRVDALTLRYGSGTIYLGSSAGAIKNSRDTEGVVAKERRIARLFAGAYAAKRLPLPYLGEVN
jgi:DNA polymerase-4/DNA polymerase V